ncbi:MAG: tetraacyldisaccharide 4'-kinase [Dethiosulfovibrio peptidovorans]|nr:MAG: tetraacyldisaccharide 4'-kinase [Dethiosulfovibrio peptidovorans]
MNSFVRSYLAHARGEAPLSPWLCLAPLGWLVSLLTRCRNGAFDRGVRRSQEPPLPVISVGNVTLGGTNKTPFVELLSKGLLARGIQPGIVSRGYGGQTSRPVVFRGGRADRDQVGDEPLLLSHRLPQVDVAVSRDRMGDIRALGRRGVQVVVADDAFQHRRLGRDVDVVLIDASCPFGNGRLIPGGILREPLDSLRRAHIVVITKVDQVEPSQLRSLERRLKVIVPEERLFRSSLRISRWCRWNGTELCPSPPPHNRAVVAFSAIGSPRSFLVSLQEQGVSVAREYRFKDHHRYDLRDLEEIGQSYRTTATWAVVCTEKDVYNLPSRWEPAFPLLVPLLESELEDESRFWKTLTEFMRPRIVVASNGYGEDAMGALLAQKLHSRFPQAQVVGFPLVGRGELYGQRGIPVASAPSVTPTGGVVKYHLDDLVSDIRSGLLGHIKAQIKAWRRLRGIVRTPLCVGDVYLLLHTLWGQGLSPVLVATAKTAYLHGHFMAEQAILRRRCRIVWTRDRETAQDLCRSGVRARYGGNPIMDLVGDTTKGAFRRDVAEQLVLILPGSRERAYCDMRLLLRAVDLMARRERCSFVAVLAPTLDIDRLVQGCPGWFLDGPSLVKDDVRVDLYDGPVADVAREAQVLLGLGGTANQVCAGLGVPVISILEKGKLVQKKLLGQAEWLVPSDPRQLADAALTVLRDSSLAQSMGEAGKLRLGGSGALDDVIRYCSRRLGWALRCSVYKRLRMRQDEMREETNI